MSNFVVSLLLAVGGGGWLYFKFSNRTGQGNNGPAVIGATVSSLVLFVIIFLTLSSFINK